MGVPFRAIIKEMWGLSVKRQPFHTLLICSGFSLFKNLWSLDALETKD